MGLDSHSGRAVAIVTGGSSGAGRDVARHLASWTWPVVIVYLEHQAHAEATAAEIIAAGGTTVTVRADLADDLDVQRLFTESIAAFGDVDVVVHTTTDKAALLYEQTARQVCDRGALVLGSMADRIAPDAESRLRTRGIAVERGSPGALLSFLDSWRRQTVA
jgi:NAD(P)-dependent dehydrogenase (short-subunit alcohol dehydrogenase family)